MQEQIAALRRQAEEALAAAPDVTALEEFRVAFLARKGKVAELFDALRNAPADQKPVLGKELNALRTSLQETFDTRVQSLSRGPSRQVQGDLTLPGRKRYQGSVHPITGVLNEITAIFVSMGFGIADGLASRDVTAIAAREPYVFFGTLGAGVSVYDEAADGAEF